MFNEENSVENYLNLDSHSEIGDTTLKFENNDINLNKDEKNIIKKKEIFVLVYNKIETPVKKEIQNENKKVNKAENNSELSIKLIPNIVKRFQTYSSEDIIYRKDAYYKHFKVILGKYIKNKINQLKNNCFPYYSQNNFSTPNYKYIGNPKGKDNFEFLSFTIKELLLYGKDKSRYNRQYNNEMLIKFIEENGQKAKDKNAYEQLINFINTQLENIIIQFYDDKNEFDKINKDSKCIKFDSYYKRETGISLLKKYGFLEALNKYNH